ncbi:phage portal protein [Rheinheimera fenheensis]|uniref:phage portal protein n=1 Tax=Rheinheimera fenheensis TaxID=3152295 RepID=UPI003260D1C5
MMQSIKKLFGKSAPTPEKRSDPLENPANPLSMDELADYLTNYSHVSEESGMRLAAVYSCIYVLSSNLAQLPLHVMRRVGDKVEKATDHPAYWLLHDEPNEYLSSYDWRETAQAHAVGWGNSLSKLVRNRKGELQKIVQAKAYGNSINTLSGRLYYGFNHPDEGLQTVSHYDCIHIKAFGSNQRWGKSPITQHAEAIGLGLAAQGYGLQFFQGGGRPTGVLSAKGAMNDKTFASLLELWKKSKTQLQQDTNKTLLLPADLDYKAITIAPNDAQFLETRKMTRSEIAGIFNVPAHMINDLEKASFSNITESSINFVRYTMMPYIMKWEQELNRKIFTAQERKAGYYVKFNVKGLLRATPKEQAEIVASGINAGYLNRNEARMLDDMNPVEGLDEYLISVNAAQQTGKTNKGETDE